VKTLKKGAGVFFLAGMIAFSAGSIYGDYISLSPAVFIPRQSTTTYYKSTSGSYLDTYVAPCIYFAPVFLPQGAVIDGIFFFYYDENSDSGGYMTCILERLNYDTGNDQELFRVNSQGSAPGVRKTGTWTLWGGSRVVKNQSFAYYIKLWFNADPNLRFHGVRIHYHMP